MGLNWIKRINIGADQRFAVGSAGGQVVDNVQEANEIIRKKFGLSTDEKICWFGQRWTGGPFYTAVIPDDDQNARWEIKLFAKDEDPDNDPAVYE